MLRKDRTMKIKSEPRVYRLVSSAMIYTPGMIRWLQSLPKAQARKIFKAGWPTLPDKVRNGVLDGSIPYIIENESVVFTV